MRVKGGMISPFAVKEFGIQHVGFEEGDGSGGRQWDVL